MNQVRFVIELRVAEVQKELNLIKNHHCSNKRRCCYCYSILSTHDHGRVRAEEVEESAILSLEQSFQEAKQILYGWKKIYDKTTRCGEQLARPKYQIHHPRMESYLRRRVVQKHFKYRNLSTKLNILLFERGLHYGRNWGW